MMTCREFAELLLDLLQRHALGLRNHHLHPNKLENHHPGKKRENVAGREGCDHLREKRCQRGSEDPVREAAERLALGALPIRKDLRNKHPNDRALTDGMRGDEGEDTNRHDAVVLGKKSPGNQTERADVSERADKEKRAATEPVNQPEADEGENQVGQPNPDGLQQGGLCSEAGKFKHAGRKIQNRVDA